MVENSSAGLVMVGGDVSVTVTKEERHQRALAAYRGGATVAVELSWCVIESGKYRGERAIEVRLDGRRVGELTYLMSQRYGPLVSRVGAGGGRPGCEAVIEPGAKGVEITLRLPREGAAAIPVPPATPEETTIVMSPVPAQVAGSERPKLLSSRPFWIAAAVFTILLFGIIGSIGKDEDTPAAVPAAETTSTTSDEPTTTTTTPPPPTTTTTTPPPPKPKPVPKPKVTTEEPAPPPPAPEPEPVSNCDPNYSGCVPVADDVDCAGGSGNGPAYVQGPVQVIGSDIYGLDSNDDGVGCES